MRTITQIRAVDLNVNEQVLSKRDFTTLNIREELVSLLLRRARNLCPIGPGVSVLVSVLWFLFPTGKEQILTGICKPSSASTEQLQGTLMSSPVVVRLADVNIYQVYFNTNF